MSDSSDRMKAVRDAYRLIHGYQASLLQILDEARRVLEIDVYWEWEPTAGRQPTHRRCPLQGRGAAHYEPLLWSWFYYTNRGQDQPIKAGDRVLAIKHNADTEFACDNGPVESLAPNDRIEACSDRATSELSLQVLVSENETKSSWRQVDENWNLDLDIYPEFSIGNTPAGYRACEKPGEWAFSTPVALEDGARLHAFAACASMEALSNSNDIDRWLRRLLSRVNTVST